MKTKILALLLVVVLANDLNGGEAFAVGVAGVSQQLMDKLRQAGLKAEIEGRPKHFYSIYRKMYMHNKEFAEIYENVFDPEEVPLIFCQGNHDVKHNPNSNRKHPCLHSARRCHTSWQ